MPTFDNVNTGRCPIRIPSRHDQNSASKSVTEYLTRTFGHRAGSLANRYNPNHDAGPCAFTMGPQEVSDQSLGVNGGDRGA
jgi:hypothetical protein